MDPEPAALTYSAGGFGVEEVDRWDHDEIEDRENGVSVIANGVKGDGRDENDQEVCKSSSSVDAKHAPGEIGLLETQFPAVEIPFAGVRTRRELISEG